MHQVRFENASPASAAADLSQVDAAAAVAKIGEPPMAAEKRPSLGDSGVRAKSLPALKHASRRGPDAPPPHALDRSDSAPNIAGTLSVSEGTRRILERMDARQVEAARAGFARVKLQRQKSRIRPEDLGRYTGGRRSSRGSSRMLASNRRSSVDGDEANGTEVRLKSIRRPSSGDEPAKRLLSRSTPKLGKQLDSFASYSDGEQASDGDDDEDDDNDESLHGGCVDGLDDSYAEGYVGTVREGVPPRDADAGAPADEGGAARVNGAGGDEGRDGDGAGGGGRRVHRMSQRRGGIHRNSAGTQKDPWRPLSSTQRDSELRLMDKRHSIASEADARGGDDRAGDEKGEGGIGGLWNRMSRGVRSSLFQEAPDAPRTAEETAPRQPSAASYLRKGKRRENKCQFLKAVVMYNLALVRQREELGEDHLDCAATLNEIGSCWMLLGERYPALTAFEEALYIRQKRLGDGAMEVAETTNNIWMILHEEREEMERLMEEGDEEEVGAGETLTAKELAATRQL